jgi:hypothetical protein
LDVTTWLTVTVLQYYYVFGTFPLQQSHFITFILGLQ